MCRVFHMLIVLSLLGTRRASGPGFRPPAFSAPGDVIIDGIFPIHEAVKKDQDPLSAPHLQPCVRFDIAGLTQAWAMINALESINKSPVLRDLGLTLGYRIHDSCSDVSTALKAVADFTQGHCWGPAACEPPVVALIGASSSEISIAVARQLTLNMIPQISYSSTAVILSDKTRFPAFMRTVPSDMYQTQAMARLLSDSGWDWVGVVTTDGDYGLSALGNFVSQASDKGICVAFKEILPDSVISTEVHHAIRQAVRAILENPKVRVIVSFAKPAHMQYLFEELRAQLQSEGLRPGATRWVWVASDSWSYSGFVLGRVKLEDIGDVLGFTFKNGDPPSSSRYRNRSQAVGNMSFQEESYTQLNANDKHPGFTPRALENLTATDNGGMIFSVEMAASAISHAVAALCGGRDCRRDTLRPWELLKALRFSQFEREGESFSFDRSGDINLGYDVTMWRSEGGAVRVGDVVAEYHPQNNSFTHTSTATRTQLLDLRVIVSKCSSCRPGEFKKTAGSPHTCCYACINCTENYYSNATDMDQCLGCDAEKEWSHEGSSSCIPKTLVFFSWQDGFAVVLVSLAALGILLVLLVGALFVWKRHTPVVRAAGGPLSQGILLSLVCSFISAMLFVGQPSNLQCKARQVLFGLSFTLCVSCILVKSLKILLAFQFNPDLQQLLRRLYKPYVIVACCVALQAVTCVCWLVLKSPFDHIVTYPTTRLAECHEGSYAAFGAMLGYIAVLALVCFICAFKGRKLPEKYNEAKFITFGMLLSLISWLIFVPVYVTTSGMYVPAVEMVVILISNYGILTCHFFPKCYVILFRKEQNTRSAFHQDLYAYSSKSIMSLSVSKTSLQKEAVSQPYTISAPSLFLPPLELIVPQVCSDVIKYRDSCRYKDLVAHRHKCLRSISM